MQVVLHLNTITALTLKTLSGGTSGGVATDFVVAKSVNGFFKVQLLQL